MRMVVCGGRHFLDFRWLCDVLDAIHASRGPVSCLIEGDATGVDELAGNWARMHGIECVAVRAEWMRYGRSAGPRCNQAIIAMRPDLAVAFPGGTGTADMVRRAKTAGIEVVRAVSVALPQ